MKVFLSITILSALLAFVAGQSCSQGDNCNIADQCLCASTDPPISGELPQLVSITFHDAISNDYVDDIYIPLLYYRTNPDGQPVSATFYVPHEYTDYSRVNELYNAGYEIGVHTITKDSSSEYWASASVSTLVQEFQGQREIISKFANIPIEDVIGARVPNFELAGNNLFEAYQQSGIEYDNTWTARSENRYFPFSLEFANVNMPCIIGSCPTQAFSDVWVCPVVDLEIDGLECNNLLGCPVEDSVSAISNWLYQQFMNVYSDNRAPITLAASAAWFLTYENGFDGMSNFLDRIALLDDVYLVAHKQVVDFMKNPVTSNNYVPSAVGGSSACSRRSCPLEFNDEIRYMVACVSACPSQYPWLGNPTGS